MDWPERFSDFARERAALLAAATDLARALYSHCESGYARVIDIIPAPSADEPLSVYLDCEFSDGCFECGAAYTHRCPADLAWFGLSPEAARAAQAQRLLERKLHPRKVAQPLAPDHSTH